MDDILFRRIVESRRKCWCHRLFSNTSSQGGITGFPGQAAYISCKHAIIGLTRNAAIDYAAKGIRINAVLPGVIATPMAKDIIKRNPEMEKEFVRDIPKGRLGEPYEIAHAVMWLCSL